MPRCRKLGAISDCFPGLELGDLVPPASHVGFVAGHEIKAILNIIVARVSDDSQRKSVDDVENTNPSKIVAVWEMEKVGKSQSLRR